MGGGLYWVTAMLVVALGGAICAELMRSDEAERLRTLFADYDALEAEVAELRKEKERLEELLVEHGALSVRDAAREEGK